MAGNIFKSVFIYFVFVCLCYISHGETENHAHKIKEHVTVESVPYSSPHLKSSGVYFAEHFDNPNEFKRKWILSKAKKPDVSEDLAQYNGKWDLSPLERFPLKGDSGLLLVSESRHSAIVSKFNKPFHFDGKKKFIVQYVVTFQKQVDCGGAYLKLLTEGSLDDLSSFNDKTPYSIMFGPDKCGGVPKMHFIIRHKNPVNGTVVEKHCMKLKIDDSIYKDQEPHLFKLIIEPNNDFSFYVDNSLNYEGNLLDEETFQPPINPPKEVVDETDLKPKDWDDRPKIPDPDAKKPDDWNEDEPAEIPDPNALKPEGWLDDEPLTVPDEDAVKPTDWDEDMDGEWEPPMIQNRVCGEAPGCGPWNPPMIENPKYKGKWKPPMIDNPDYKGKWVPKKIPNPDYYYDDTPLKGTPIGYVGFELWSLVNNVYFDDILVTEHEPISQEWTTKTWSLKKQSIAAESATFFKMFLDYTNNNPWLWAVYLSILTIVVGLIGSCYLRLRRNKDDFESDVSAKKTDEYQPDDEGLDESQHRRGANHTSGVDTADKKSANDDVEAGDDDGTDPYSQDEQNSKSSSEVDDDDEEEDDEKDKEEPKECSSPSSPRKRRLRRD